MSNRIQELKDENQKLREANRRLQASSEELERDKQVQQLRERVAELEAHAEVVNNYFYQIAEIVGTDEYAEEVDIIENLQLKAEELDYLLGYIDVDSKDEAVAEIERRNRVLAAAEAYVITESAKYKLLEKYPRPITANNMDEHDAIFELTKAEFNASRALEEAVHGLRKQRDAEAYISLATEER